MRIATVVLVGVVACGKGQDKPTRGSAAEEVPPLPVFASGELPACPYTVEGARLVYRETAAGVEIVVTSSSPSETEEIRRRARELGTGTASCPILGADVAVAAEDIDEGTRISITPTQPENIDRIRKDVRRRLANK